MSSTSFRRRIAALLSTLGIAMLAAPMLASVAVAAPPASYTFNNGDCSVSGRKDPLNVRWFNYDELGVRAAILGNLAHWGNISGGQQWAYGGDGQCHVMRWAGGAIFGPPSRDHSVEHREKIHIRLFDTGESQVGGDAHRERKVRCDNSSGTQDTFSNDVVYKYFNGSNGFDAAMDKFVTAFSRTNATVSVVRSGGPFVSMFQQCNGTWVPWSGDVAYITRNP